MIYYKYNYIYISIMPTLTKINNAFSRNNYPILKNIMKKKYNNCYGSEECIRNILMNIVYLDVKLKTCEIGRRVVNNYIASRRRTEY